MRFSVLKLAVTGILPLALLVSCTTGWKHDGGGIDSTASVSSALSSSSYIPATDINAEAQRLGVSPGRVALGEIICRLDSSNRLDDLVPKNDAQELFEILRETALQKSTTLEAINEKYGLTDILASEGIHVDISSNGVTLRSNADNASPGGNDWITHFQAAIFSAGPS